MLSKEKSNQDENDPSNFSWPETKAASFSFLLTDLDWAEGQAGLFAPCLENIGGYLS